jgi:hypothetical protein
MGWCAGFPTARDCLQGVRLNVVVTRPCRRAEEVTVSYGVLAGRDALRERQRVLADQYLFRCRCEACVADLRQQLQWDEQQQQRQRQREQKQREEEGEEERLSAECVKAFCRSMDVVRGDIETANVQFTDCLRRARLAPTVVQSAAVLQSFYDSALTAVGRRLESVRQSLPSLRRVWAVLQSEVDADLRTSPVPSSWQQQLSPLDTEVLREFVALHCQWLDICAHCASSAGRFAAAAADVRRSIAFFLRAGLYDERDVVVAREAVKLAGLLFSAGETCQCAQWASRAMDGLRGFVADDDPVWRECHHLSELTRRLLSDH